MSSLATIPDNVGIRGDAYNNPGKYFISNEIKTAFLKCYSVLTNIQKNPLNSEQNNGLIRQVSNVYNRIEKYLEKAIENKTHYTPLEFDTFFETCTFKELFEIATKPETKASYKDQAFQEYTTCELPSFNTRVNQRHVELLQLIEVKEEFSPSLKFQIEQLGGFSLSSEEFEMADTTFADFCDVLQEASEGEYSPAFVSPAAEVLETCNEIVTASPSVKITINHNAGWGYTLGICCEPDWEKQPIALSNVDNDWSGNIPTGKNWKFVILKDSQIINWEIAEDRKCEANSSACNYTGQVKFS